MIAPEALKTEYVLDEPRDNEIKVFPLRNHPLYGSIERFEDSGYLLPKTLADFTHEYSFQGDVTNLEICPTCFFNTSGTTSRSKRIPYSNRDLDRQRIHEAMALRKLGMGPGDAVVSLGSPLPSISGWAIVNGSEMAGASVLNTSQIDYEDVFLRKQEEKATIVIGTPLVVKEIGLAIQEEHGPVPQVFPKLKTAIIFGDVLPNGLRCELQAIWGFENIYSLYGTVEADVVATESRQVPGQMDLMLERLMFEIISDEELAKERTIAGYHPKAVDIREAADGTTGEIVISDLARDILPLIRYRIGDIVRVHRKPGRPKRGDLTISLLGRSKNTVLLGDVSLYEMDLTDAIETALGDRLQDWRFVQGANQVVAFTLYLRTTDRQVTDEDRKGVLEAISGRCKGISMQAVTELIGIEQLSEEYPQGTDTQGVVTDLKAKRIVLAAGT